MKFVKINAFVFNREKKEKKGNRPKLLRSFKHETVTSVKHELDVKQKQMRRIALLIFKIMLKGYLIPKSNPHVSGFSFLF